MVHNFLHFKKLNLKFLFENYIKNTNNNVKKKKIIIKARTEKDREFTELEIIDKAYSRKTKHYV